MPENLGLINDILEQTKTENKSGILLSLDFKKAFDTLEWSFIQNTLSLFNFGESIKRWVTILYTNIESAVLNNGYATNWFKPSRGVRQGCPLSPYLFILGAEILSTKIWQCKQIKEIDLYGNEAKISQFADDTNLFCADVVAAEGALNVINIFGNVSGLKSNVKKTKAVWLGKWSKNRATPLLL